MDSRIFLVIGGKTKLPTNTEMILELRLGSIFVGGLPSDLRHYVYVFDLSKKTAGDSRDEQDSPGKLGSTEMITPCMWWDYAPIAEGDLIAPV